MSAHGINRVWYDSNFENNNKEMLQAPPRTQSTYHHSYGCGCLSAGLALANVAPRAPSTTWRPMAKYQECNDETAAWIHEKLDLLAETIEGDA